MMLDFRRMREQFEELLRDTGCPRDRIQAEADEMVEFERAGAARASRVLGTWCQCEGSYVNAEGATVTAFDESEYFLRPDGSHGWFHPACGGITQTG